MRTSLVITEVVKEKSLNALGLFLQQNPKQTDKLFLLSLNDLSFFQAVVRNEQDKLRAGDIFPSYRHLIDFYWLLIEFVNKQSTSQIKELQVLMQQSIVKNKLPSEADMLLAKQFIRSGVIKLAQGNELLVEALRNLGDFLEKGHAFFPSLKNLCLSYVVGRTMFASTNKVKKMFSQVALPRELLDDYYAILCEKFWTQDEALAIAAIKAIKKYKIAMGQESNDPGFSILINEMVTKLTASLANLLSGESENSYKLVWSKLQILLLYNKDLISVVEPKIIDWLTMLAVVKKDMLVLLLLQQRSINGDSQSLIDKLRKELLILGHEQFSKEALLLAPYCKQIFAANSIHDFLYKNLFDIFGKYDGENGSFRSLMFYCCKEYDLKSNSMPTELMLPLDLVHTLIDSKLASPALESALRRLEEIITIMQKYDFSPIFSVNVDVMAMTSIEASELSLMV